jgi:hypothetical protein
MKREEIQKLLGGYATGTLTPEEQQTLFAAALEDQELFDALGREQVLRDLLREPAAKAELLAALDSPAAERGSFRVWFWTWMRRPLVAGLATAGVAAIAGLAVWQGTRGTPAPPVPTMLAEVKAPEPGLRDLKVPEAPPPAAPAVTKAPAPKRVERSAGQDVSSAKDIVATANTPSGQSPQPAAAPPAPAAEPAPSARSGSLGAVAETQRAVPQASVSAQLAEAIAATEKPTQQKGAADARTLFYRNAFAPIGANNGVPQEMTPGQAGAQPPNARKAVAATMRASSVLKNENAPFSLGVRVSILRGDQEAAVGTVLNPGESVRLKLTPNQDGFLYVAAREGDAWKMVAGGPAQRLKPFETPPLPFTGSGLKQLYVMLSRQPRTLAPESIAGLVRNNLVEAQADQDRATYVVSGLQNGAPQQIVQPITLTYR